MIVVEGKRAKQLEQFIKGKDNLDKALLYLCCELFNPNNPQVDDDFVDKLLDTGEKIEDPGENSFWVNGGEKLTLENALPPQGTLDGEKWLGIKDLKKLF